MRSFLWVCLACPLSLAVLQAGDEQKNTARQKIAAQKLIVQVAEALDQSRKFSPQAAEQLMREMLDRVQNSMDLTPSQSADLQRRLQARLRVIEDGRARAKKLAVPFEKTVVGTPGKKDDSILPPNWKPFPTTSLRMTDKEKQLVKTLRALLSVDYDGDKFRQVIKQLEEKSGLTINLDKGSLDDLEVHLDGPVTLKVEKYTVRSILKKILGDQGLTYVIKEGEIHVVTPKRAEDHVVVRSYEVDAFLGADLGNRILPPLAVKQVRLQSAKALIAAIQNAIEPNHWQPHGPGVITYHDPCRVLIIRASVEFHLQLAAPSSTSRR